MVPVEGLAPSKLPLLGRVDVLFSIMPHGDKNGAQGRSCTDYLSFTKAAFTSMNFKGLKWWVVRESHPVLMVKSQEHHILMLTTRKWMPRLGSHQQSQRFKGACVTFTPLGSEMVGLVGVAPTTS